MPGDKTYDKTYRTRRYKSASFSIDDRETLVSPKFNVRVLSIESNFGHGPVVRRYFFAKAITCTYTCIGVFSTGPESPRSSFYSTTVPGLELACTTVSASAAFPVTVSSVCRLTCTHVDQKCTLLALHCTVHA